MWYGSLILTSSRSASTGSSQGLRENRGCIKITHRHSSGLWTQMDMNGAASIWTQWPVTHCVSDCFSEKTRMQKSPFRCGSKVDGTIRYSPGGSLKRVLTSRRLMKVSDFAVWACVRKKFLSRCTSRCPWNWKVKVKGKELFLKKIKTLWPRLQSAESKIKTSDEQGLNFVLLNPENHNLKCADLFFYELQECSLKASSCLSTTCWLLNGIHGSPVEEAGKHRAGTV